MASRFTRAAVGLPQNQAKPRISKAEGSVMIGVALLFDLLPILLIVGPIVAIFAATGSNPDCSWTGGLWNFAVCKAANITGALGGIAAVIAIFIISPMIYTIGSVLGMFLGFFVFSVWLGMFRRVSPLPLLFYLVFEIIPVVNLLPVFTRGVYKIVKGVQREDGERAASTASQQYVNVGRNSVSEPAYA